MATPTETEVRNQIEDRIDILEATFDFFNANTPNFAALYDVAVSTMEGDRSAAAMEGLDSFRAGLADVLRRGRAMLDPLWVDYGKVLDFPEDTAEGVLGRLFIEFAERATPQSVKERNFVFGSPSMDGGNVGDGVLNRLNIDRYAKEIESQFNDAKTARCVADEHSGSVEHEEVFEVRGGNRARDLIAFEGSGLAATLKALSGRDSEAFMRNPSFAQFTGTDITTGLTAITGWTIGTGTIGTDIHLNETTVYRGYNGEGATPRSLKLLSSGATKLSQNFNVVGAQFSPFVPYYVQVAVNKSVGSGVGGNFILRFGGITVTTTVLSLASGWNIIRVPIGSSNWLRQFNKEDPTIEVEWATSTSTGHLFVDDVIIAPYQNFDNSWYALVGGATPFLRNDKATWADTIATDAKIQKWLWFLYGLYLPAAVTPTWADPA